MKTTKNLLFIFSKLIITFIVVTQFLRADDAISPRFMSINELRECAKENARQKDRMAFIGKTRKQLEEELAAFTNEAGTLASVLEALSKKQTQVEMDAYNARVGEYNRRVEDHRRRTITFNLDVNEQNKAAAVSMRSCATRPLRLEDQEVVLKE